MMTILLWLETVLLTAVAAAVLLSWAMRLAPSRWRLVGLAVAAFLPVLLAPGSLWTLGFWLSFYIGGIPIWSLSGLLLTSITSNAWLFWRARRDEPWKSWRLASGLAAAVVLTLTTFTLAEQAVIANLRTRSGESLAVATTVMPVSIPDEQNAAIPYTRAIPSLESQDLIKFKTENNGFRKWTDDDPRFREILQKLTEWREPLADLHEGGRRSGCWFERDFSSQALIDVTFRELVPLMNGAHLLWLDAHARFATGDVIQGWRSVESLSRLAQHYAREPFLLCQLVAVSIDGMAFTAATAGLKHPDQRELADIHIPEANSWSRQLRRALIMEQASGSQAMALANIRDDVLPLIMQQVVANDQLENSTNRPWLRLYTVFLLEADFSDFQRTLTAWRRATQKTWTDWQREEAEFDRRRGNPQERHIFGSLLLPAVKGAAEYMAVSEGQRSLVRLALAARTHRRTTGSWPANPEALAGIMSWPRDPFTDSPLRAEVREGKLVLWSIGPDGVDDHGDKEWDRAKKTGDLVLTVSP